MATTDKREMTLDEFLALPETEPASEFYGGRVVQKAMPTMEHGHVQTRFSVLLDRYLDEAGGGFVGSEVRCIFGPPGHERPVVPDVIVIAAERLPDDDGPWGTFYGAPDVAIEILSPDDNVAEVMLKLFFYRDNGVRLIVVADPKSHEISVYRPGEAVVTLRSGDTLDGGDVLPGFRVAVDEIFRRRGRKRDAGPAVEQ